MKLGDLIVKDAIVAQLQSTGREDAIEELIAALVQAGAIPADQAGSITKALMDRERHGSTGFGKGVAVPHAKHAAVKHQVAAIGRSTNGIDFAALDQAPVYTVVLLLSSPDSPEGHARGDGEYFSPSPAGFLPAVFKASLHPTGDH